MNLKLLFKIQTIILLIFSFLFLNTAFSELRVSWHSPEQTLQEGEQSSVTLTISSPQEYTVYVPYTIKDIGTTLQDHGLENSTLVIPPNISNVRLDFGIEDNDTLYEGTEIVILKIETPIPANITPFGNPQHVIFIEDNDPKPFVNWYSSNQSVTENAGEITLSASLSTFCGLDVKISYSVSGTAAYIDDHDLIEQIIIIPAGEISKSISFSIINDLYFEDTEEIILTMKNPVNADIGDKGTYTLYIHNDNDTEPEASWSKSNQTVAESVQDITITAIISALSGTPINIPYTVTGTAKSSEHSLTNGTITIPVDSLSSTISFTIVNDDIYENNETIIVNMGKPDIINASGITTHTITISSDETDIPDVKWTKSTENITENVTSISITATISAISERDMYVNYYSIDSSAKNNIDFQFDASPLVIEAGTLSNSFNCNIINDSYDEPEENFSFYLPDSNSIEPKTLVINISDDDPPPDIYWSSSFQEISENTLSGTITAKLNVLSAFDINVLFEVSNNTAIGEGIDYSIPDGSISIQAGNTFASKEFTIINDLINEGDESFYITMKNPANAILAQPSIHTITITDDDYPPTIQWLNSTLSINENSGEISIIAMLDKISSKSISASYTIGGTASGNSIDHNLTDGTITISAGQNQASISFNIINDNFDEYQETIILNMFSPQNADLGATNTLVLTIEDDDESPLVMWSKTSDSVTETVQQVFISAEIDNISEKQISIPFIVSGSAAKDQDHYLSNDTIIILPGQTSASYTINLNDDLMDEFYEETIVLTIDSPINAIIGEANVYTLTIFDDDPGPPIYWSSLEQRIDENIELATVTASISIVSGIDVEVPFLVSGTASGSGVDFLIEKDSIIIKSGEKSASLTIEMVNDIIYESTESIILTIDALSGANRIYPYTHTIHIEDDEAYPVVNFQSSKETVTEKSNSISITANLSVSSAYDITVPVLFNGSALGSGTDYMPLNDKFFFPKGSKQSSFKINIIDDLLYEISEFITIEMKNPVNTTIGFPDLYSITVLNSTPMPEVQFSQLSQSLIEQNSEINLSLNLDRLSALDTLISYSIYGTASGNGTDYSLFAGELIIPAGESGITKKINIFDDNLYENNETIIIELINSESANIGPNNTHTITINNNDPMPEIAFSTNTINISENSNVISISLNLNTESQLDVHAPISITGTAKSNGLDYSMDSSDFIIPAGSLTCSRQIIITNDLLDEYDETIILSIDNPVNAASGSNKSETITILDDDSPPFINWLNSFQSISEDQKSLSITASLSEKSCKDVFVKYSITGTASGNSQDYTDDLIEIIIKEGELQITKTFLINDDIFDENDETIIISMEDPINTILGDVFIQSITILDNDPKPYLKWTKTNQEINEDSGSVTIEASLSQKSNLNISALLGIEGSAIPSVDFILDENTINFAPGQTNIIKTIIIVDDNYDEIAENFKLSFKDPVNVILENITQTITIIDNDPLPIVNWQNTSQTVAEDTEIVTITAKLNTISGQKVTVPYSVSGDSLSGGTDHSLSDGIISIPAGQISSSKEIIITNDLIDEKNETIIISITNPINAQKGDESVQTIEILDDDEKPSVSFQYSDLILSEDSNKTNVKVQLTHESGFDVVIPFNIAGTASQGIDYNLSKYEFLIKAGSLSDEIIITLIDDDIKENDETVILNIGTPENAIKKSPYNFVLTIEEDDPTPIVSWTTQTRYITEDSVNLTITANLTQKSSFDISIEYEISGTASGNNIDHNLNAGNIRFNAQQLTSTKTFTIIDDTFFENDETIIITLKNSQNVIIGNPYIQTIYIKNDDTKPVVSFNENGQDVNEIDSTINISTNIDLISGLDVTIPFIIKGSATGNNIDYDISSSSIIIPAGQKSALLSININSDDLREIDESIILKIDQPVNANVGTPDTYTLNIIDKNVNPKISWSTDNIEISESQKTLSINLNLSEITGMDEIIPIDISGTAANGNDFFLENQIIIPSGSISITKTFNISNDNFDENNETIYLKLNPTAYADFGDITVLSINIIDDDPLPLISWNVNESQFSENNGKVEILAKLEGMSSFDISIPLTLEGTASSNDYKISTDQLLIKAFELSGKFYIDIINDNIYELDETISLIMNNTSLAEIFQNPMHTLIIKDDEPVPEIKFLKDFQETNENSGYIILSAVISGLSSLDVNILFDITGTASGNNVDFNIQSNSIVIPAGSLTSFKTISIIDDNLPEITESIVLTMNEPEHCIKTTPFVHTVNIIDNEPKPTVQWKVLDQTVNENVESTTITAFLNRVSGVDVIVKYELSGTASGNGIDYILDSDIVIPAGSLEASKIIYIIDDPLYENAEKITITIKDPLFANAGQEDTHSIIIYDNDSLPTVQWSKISQNYQENIENPTNSITLDKISGLDTIVSFQIQGTATINKDFSIENEIIIPAGQLSASKTFEITNDIFDEFDETILLKMDIPVNALKGINSDKEITIIDDDPNPYINWSFDKLTILENSQSKAITATLSQISEKQITVSYKVSGTSNVFNQDHNLEDSTLIFEPGTKSQRIDIHPLTDQLYEGDETIILTIYDTINAINGDIFESTITIKDLNPIPEVFWSIQERSISEDVGNINISASLNSLSELDVIIPLLIEGTASGQGNDYTFSNDQIIISGGKLNTSIPVTIIDDEMYEYTETVILTMQSPQNAILNNNNTYSLNIKDNDIKPYVSWQIDESSISESSNSVQITVCLNIISGKDSIIPVIASGSATDEDYILDTNQIIISAGSKTAKMQVQIIDDDKLEKNETIILQINSPINANLNEDSITYHNINILDNDPFPIVNWEQVEFNIEETYGIISFKANLNEISELDTIVNISLEGTAKGDGIDYSIIEDVLFIESGKSQGNFSIKIIDDDLFELNESLILIMKDSQNAVIGENSKVNIEITSNDPMPSVYFYTKYQEVPEDIGTVYITSILDKISNLDTTIPFEISGKASGSGIDHSLQNGKIIIPAGMKTKTLQVLINDDKLYEDDEDLTIYMTNPSNAISGITNTHTVKIINNDPIPILNWTKISQNISENSDEITANLELSEICGLDVTVPLSLTGLADLNYDYSISQQYFIIKAGQKIMPVTIDLKDDLLNEYNETIIIEFKDLINAVAGPANLHKITIQDNDPMPSIGFKDYNKAISEQDETASFEIVLSSASGKDVKFLCSLSGDAVNDQSLQENKSGDYSFIQDLITIPAGVIRKVISFPIISDTFFENDEKIVLTIKDPINASIGTINTHTITIINDDNLPFVNWQKSSQLLLEDSGYAWITATIDNISGLDTKFTFNISGNATGKGVDYILNQDFLIIPQGAKSASISISIVDDLIYENIETIIIEMNQVYNAQIGIQKVHAIGINSNEEKPTAFWSIQSQKIIEYGKNVEVKVKIDRLSDLNVIIPFTVTGTAVGNSVDYKISNDKITILKGEDYAILSFEIKDDYVNEGDETIIITMGEPINAQKGNIVEHTVIIEDDDDLPTVEWSFAEYSINENAKNFTIDTILSYASGLIVYVPYIVSGSASGNGQDHTLMNGTITIPAGLRSQSLGFNIIDDNHWEDVETVIIKILNPTNAKNGLNSTFTLYIKDDDILPYVNFSNHQQIVKEENVFVSITATLSSKIDLNVSIPFKVGGTASGGIDHYINNGIITILAGQTQVSKQYQIVSDNIDETDENIIITMASPINAQKGDIFIHTITIQDDDDPPTVNWSNNNLSLFEDHGFVNIDAVLNIISGYDIIVPFDVSGTSTYGKDHNLLNAELLIPNGSKSAKISFEIIDDTIDEKIETIIVNMHEPMNAVKGSINNLEIEINDNDPTPLVFWDKTAQIIAESEKDIKITAKLSAISGQDVKISYQVSGSATILKDHDLTSGNIIIPAGNISQDIGFNLFQDNISDNNENIIATIINVENAIKGEPYIQIINTIDYIFGDINKTGLLNLRDAIISLQILSNIDNSDINYGGDVNSDNKIGIQEIIYILKKIGKL